MNAKIPTGDIEVAAAELEIFSRAETPPFPIEDHIDTNEQLRLKHRYLDLRRPALQKNFLVRSQIYFDHARASSTIRPVRRARDADDGEVHAGWRAQFPRALARSIPARFYALAESPQIFKRQLFAGRRLRALFPDRRAASATRICRLDRQREFTQIDLEMSFVTEIDVQNIVEGCLAALWKGILGVEIPRPFPRISFDDAMARYGSDKPDLRLDLELGDVTEAARNSGFQIFEKAVGAGGIVKAMRVPEGERLSRSALDGLTDLVKPYGAKGVAFARVQEGGPAPASPGGGAERSGAPVLTWQAPFAKAFKDAARDAVNAKLGAQPGDVLLFVADKHRVANNAMSAIRLHVGDKLGLTRKGEWRFNWTTDMPMFEQGDDGSWGAAHHPFTSPRLADQDRLETDPGACRARAYDCVLNGNEIAGGSIRIHQRDVQSKLFKAIGLDEDTARQKFGFLLDAFKYGPPPHGGIAFGLDRLAMLLCGADSLRDVIAFPKTQKGTDLMTDAPSAVSARQLDELHVQLKPEILLK